jgi:hypothetical protein
MHLNRKKILCDRVAQPRWCDPARTEPVWTPNGRRGEEASCLSSINISLQLIVSGLTSRRYNETH